MRKILKLIFQRVVIVGAFLAIQVAILVSMILKFNNYFVYFYGISILLSAIAIPFYY